MRLIYLNKNGDFIDDEILCNIFLDHQVQKTIF
jgi:hypothetical protein